MEIPSWNVLKQLLQLLSNFDEKELAIGYVIYKYKHNKVGYIMQQYYAIVKVNSR